MAQVISHQKVAYLGGHCACPTPFQPTIIFYDGIFGCFANFSSKTSKFRHSATKKCQLLGQFVPQTPYRGFASGPHWGTSVPQTLLSHILNMPLAPELCDVNFL